MGCMGGEGGETREKGEARRQQRWETNVRVDSLEPRGGGGGGGGGGVGHERPRQSPRQSYIVDSSFGNSFHSCFSLGARTR